MSNKIITNLSAAYDEQNIDEFKNLLKKNIKFFSDVEVNPDDKFIELLNKIVDEEGYEYLIEIEMIFNSFEFHVLMYKANLLLEELYTELLKHREKEIKEKNYSVREGLESSIKMLCYFTYHAQFFGVKKIEGRNQPYFFMTKEDMERALNSIFWQLDLMLNLLKGEQNNDNPFPGSYIEDLESYEPYRKIARFNKAADKYLPKHKFTETEICEIVGVEPDTFNGWKNFKPKTGKNIDKYYSWQESFSDDELKSAAEELIAHRED